MARNNENETQSINLIGNGTVIDPIALADKYGSDSVRYSLLKCSVFEDSDYSEEILIERNNNELANKFGNLVSRTTTLAEKYSITKTENKLLKKLNSQEYEISDQIL